MQNFKKIIFLAVFSFSAIIMIYGWKLPGKNHINITPKKQEKIKGICWDGGRELKLDHFRTLEPYSVNWISITPFGYQEHYNSPEIIMTRGRTGMERRKQRIKETTSFAKQLGIKTMLKPHIWLRNHDEKWRSDIEMDSPKAWQQWFDQYEVFILTFAEIAETNKIEALCIGTELYICTSKHEQEWRQLIQKVRKVYSGQLTYAANFYKEYEEIQFWDALDFIGIQAYFPLVNEIEPNLKALKKGWSPHFNAIKSHHQKWKKPVIFTEFGYRSSKDAAIHPWEWEPRGQIDSTLICPKTQALCYEAIFDAFWNEDWMLGTFLWKWTSENYAPETISQRRRPPSPFSFSPKKEGLEVLKKWYSKNE